MATNSLPSNQLSLQENLAPISYIPVAPSQGQYILTQPTPEYYVSSEVYQNYNHHHHPPAPFQMPFPSAYGQQCIMMMHDIAIRRNGPVWHDTQSQAVVGGNMTQPPCLVENFMATPRWTYRTVPDARLNPNCREFVVKTSNSDSFQKAADSFSNFQPRKVESLPHSSAQSRNPSSEGSENGLASKVQILNLRYHSGDSGIEETSSSSPTWSSDDDVDRVTPPVGQQQLTSEDVKERVWTIWDDQKYWRNMTQFPPGDALCSSIVKQIEFYMSDEYLAKDKYLLRQIRCKKDGYVSIKLMTSFKKMKKLAQDWPVLRCAITRMSDTLVVSEEGLRIRRKQQLSEELRKPRMLTSILVIRLPETYNAVDRLTSLFRVFGEIGLVRLLRPDKAVPADLRNYATQVPDIGVSLCAVVEFESASDSLSAVRILKNRNRETSAESSDQNEEDGDNKTKEAELSEEEIARLRKLIEGMPDLAKMRLALLGPRVRRTLYRQDRAKSTEIGSTAPRDPSMNVVRAVKHQLLKAPSAKEPVLEDVSASWRKTRPLSTIVKSPSKNSNVVRQPRGPQETKGFQFRRTLKASNIEGI